MFVVSSVLGLRLALNFGSWVGVRIRVRLRFKGRVRISN